MAAPIWKDYYLDLSAYLAGGDYVDYRVKLGGTVIYTGRAVERADGTVPVRLNDILADYLGRNLPRFVTPSVVRPMDFERTFVVEYYDESIEDWDEVETVEMRNDWSYVDGFDPSVSGLSFPIDGKAAQQQWLVFTDESAEEDITVHLQYDSEGPDFLEEDFNLDFLIEQNQADIVLDAMGVGAFRVFALDLSTFPPLRTVTIGTHVWHVVGGCSARYALHYVNAFGGWDSFFVAGNGKRTDSLTHHNTGQIADNASVYPEERRNQRTFVNEVAPSYELHTGLLTDRESERMHHLLNSPQVLLEDFGEDALHRVSPVVLTGTSTPHLTYDNNGRQLMAYTITARLAEERMRR